MLSLFNCGLVATDIRKSSHSYFCIPRGIQKSFLNFSCIPRGIQEKLCTLFCIFRKEEGKHPRGGHPEKNEFHFHSLIIKKMTCGNLSADSANKTIFCTQFGQVSHRNLCCYCKFDHFPSILPNSSP